MKHGSSSMKTATKFYRLGAKVYNADRSLNQDHKTINAAKRASRELQGKTAGQGLVRVVQSIDQIAGAAIAKAGG